MLTASTPCPAEHSSTLTHREAIKVSDRLRDPISDRSRGVWRPSYEIHVELEGYRRSVGYELLSQHQDKQVIGDKADISNQIKEELAQVNGIDLITTPRRNQKRQISRQTQRWINQTRQIVETVNEQLSGQFHIKKNHAHTFWGLCTRLYAKLTAHTLCIYLNQLFKKDDWLQIKQLAFPLP